MNSSTQLSLDKTSPLLSPGALARQMPITNQGRQEIEYARQCITKILQQKDHRMLCIVGPCSIHDEQSALEYAHRLVRLSDKMKDKLLIVMRTYLEKPRTAIGWKGFISDPHLDGTMDMEDGLIRARRLLLQINALGLPTATEILDPLVAHYIADLISWSAIGARTTDSQTHRQLSSSLAMPVGFKNAVSGNINAAINAVTAANQPHSFLDIDKNGRACVVKTLGNSAAHVVLRGGDNGPNYDAATLRQTANKLAAKGLISGLIVDCSHGNSGKIASNQEQVAHQLIELRLNGYAMICGLMLESNLVEGRQDLTSNPDDLCYGLSITDECIGWERTEALLEFVYAEYQK